jgi:predicted nuclease of predicted toxin-antitoxin system
LRFLLDEHLPLGLADLIVDQGHEAIHVKTQDLLSASDADLWASAGRLDAAMVSKDSDFLALARRDGRPASLLHLNLGNLSNRDLYASVRSAWPRIMERFEEGDVVVEIRP